MTERSTRVNYFELVKSSPEVGEILTTAGEIAEQRVHPEITDGDVLSALLDDNANVIRQVIVDSRVDVEQLKADVEVRQDHDTGPYTEGQVSPQVQQALEVAEKLAEKDHREIGKNHLIAALLQDEGSEPSLLLGRLGIAWVILQKIHTDSQEPV